MKKALVYVFAVFVVLMAGIGVWYASSVAGRADRAVTQEVLAEATRRVPVTIEVEPPDSTPDDQVLYVAGSGPLGEWDAAGVALQPTDDGRHAATLELIQGVEYAFKVTRGTWGTVEVRADDQDIADRTIRAAEPKTVTVSVEAWRDKGQSIPGRITYTGDIRTHKSLPSDPLDEPRDLYIYLPPGYDQQPDRRYPVLYLQDGRVRGDRVGRGRDGAAADRSRTDRAIDRGRHRQHAGPRDRVPPRFAGLGQRFR